MSPSSGRRTCWIGLVQSSTCNPLLCASTRARRSAIVIHLLLPLLHRPYGRSVHYRGLFDRFGKIMCAYDRRSHWADLGGIHLGGHSHRGRFTLPLRRFPAHVMTPRHLSVLFPNITTPALPITAIDHPLRDGFLRTLLVFTVE